MADLGGLSLRRQQPLQGEYSGLAFRYKAPSEYGDFLEVRLDSADKTVFPRVRIGAQHVVNHQDDWVAGAGAMAGAESEDAALRPGDHAGAQARGLGVGAAGFARLHQRRGRDGDDGTRGMGMVRMAVGPPRPASLSVDCTAPGH